MKKALIPLAILFFAIIAVFVYFNRFTIVTTIKINGYALDGKNLTPNLLNGVNEESNAVTLEEVTNDDTLYKSGSQYYVGIEGQDKKKNVDLEYPIISKDASSLMTLKDNGNYIDESFNRTPVSSNTIVTDAHIFNGNNFVQLDPQKYYFMELANGTYINLDVMHFMVDGEEILIPTNSFITFGEGFVRYYTLLDTLVYKEIPYIKKDSNVKIDKFDGTYNELLLRIGVNRNAEDDYEFIEDMDGVIRTKGGTVVKNVDKPTGLDVHYAQENYDDLWGGKKYIKPEVSISNVTTSIYSLRCFLSIYDPIFVITKYPTFTFKIEDAVYLRKSFNREDNIVVEGLLPETTFDVEASYVYLNEKGQTIKRIIYEGKVTTKDISGVEDINIVYSKITTTSENFKIENLSFNNKETDEVLNGIKQVEIVYSGLRSSLGIQSIRKLVSLSTINFESPNILKSNTNYTGEIIVKDVAENVLKVNNNRISFITKKSLPKATVSVEAGKNFTTASLYFTIDNVDDVNVLRYYYTVFDADGREIVRDFVTENTKKRDIDSLDSGKKYYILLYCDYIDDDGETHNNVKIANTEFVSYDVTRLGKVYLDIKYNGVTESMQRLDVAYKNTDETFNVLYEMLDDIVTMKVINYNTDSVEITRTFTKNNFRGIGTDILLDSLLSNTSYRLEFIFTVTSGQNAVAINVDYGNKNSFKTLKLTPSFYVENLFIASGYIDFDAIVYDKDEAFQFEKSTERTVTLDVYDDDESRIYSQDLNISTGILSSSNPKVVNRVTLDNLESDRAYLFKVTAKDYDNGAVSESNYEVPTTRKYVLSGTKGSIDLNRLIKTSYYDVFRGSAEGKNLFDISNRSRWKGSGDSGTVERLQINVDDNVVSLLAQNGYRVYNYYLPEVVQSDGTKSITVSFDVKRQTGTSTDFCLINGLGTSCSGSNAYAITGVTDDYQHFDFTISEAAAAGYVSFFIGEQKNKNLKTIFDIKDLQIVVGEEANSSFKSFENGDEYVGLFDIMVNDLPTNQVDGIQILTNPDASYDTINEGQYDVYVRIKCFGEKCPKDAEDGVIVENKFNYTVLPSVEKEEVEGILSDTNYVGYLSIYNSEEGQERYYDISKISFASDKEIRTISNADEFFGMHTNGHYIAINDIDLTNDSRTYSGTFQGTLDFQGHKLFIDNRTNYKIATLGGSGVVRNVDIHYDLVGSVDKTLTYYYGLFNTLNGRLSNFRITLDTCPDHRMNNISLISQWNFGIIENFVIHSKAPLVGTDNLAFGPVSNYGIIKNGYVYGENIKAIYSSNTEENNTRNKNVGVFTVSANAGSVIKNVYSLVDIIVNSNPTNKDVIVGSLVGSASNAVIKNAITFNIEDNNTRVTTLDNMFGSTSGITSSNLYYISSNKYKDTYSRQIMAKTINDPLFLDNVINEESAFDTAGAFKYKIFPHVIWPDSMPNQDYLIIPTQETSESLSLISVDEIDYLSDDPDYLAKVLLTFHNNNLVRITGLEIEGISKIDIVDQALNRNGKTTLLYAMIGYPTVYKSKYTLTKIKSNVIDVSSNENINMDLYYPVNNLNEIHNLIDVHENFMLTRDIDCLQEECPTTSLNKVKGKINGQEYTINNFETDGCYIKELNGTLENINFRNYKVSGNKNNSALICKMAGATVNKVLMIDEELTIGYTSNNDKNIFAGGIAAVANNSLIENSGINGIKLNDSRIGGSVIVFGGMVGSSEYLSIENSFVRRLNFGVRKEIDGSSQQNGSANSNNSGGIGGMVGSLTYGNITNAYTTGKIDTDMGVCGGLVGINLNGYLDSVIGYVKITASQDEIGGVVGRVTSTTHPSRDSSVTKSIAMGAVTTLIENPSNFGRTSGSAISINGNFVWDKQAVNSRTSNNTDGETLLSTEDLSNSIIYSSKIGLSDKFFDLKTNFVVGYLPYLCIKDGGVLKGQGLDSDEDVSDRHIYYEESLSFISAQFNYQYEAGKENDPNKEYYATHASAILKLKNPNFYEVKKIDIPGMVVNNLVSTTNSEGITTLTFNAIPQRYYDSYNISKITYMAGTNEEALFPSMVIELRFFGKISSAYDWNRLVKGSLENYFIDSDIDFENATNCNYSISFNNFIGLPQNGVNPKIKNIGTSTNNLKFNSAGDALIDTIVANITNISFENIYITNNSRSGNYTGIIKFLNGNGQGLSFEHINIYAPNNSYVGIVSYNQSPDFRDITMNDITMRGISFVGGLIGRSLSRDVTNVDANEVNITSTGDYVGGLIGYEAWDSKRVHTYNVNASNFNVTVTANRTYTGGIFGYGAGNNITISDSYVEGYNRVGGIAGQDGNPSIQYNYVINTDIVGRGSYIGGLTGINTTRYYSYLDNSIVHCNTDTCSTNYVGGISGGGNWYTILYSGVKNSTINGGRAVGGIKGLIGYTYMYGNYVKDTTVVGNTNVGGLAGETSQRYNFMYLNTTNATVQARTHSAGGILGYGYNLYTSDTEGRIYIYRNIVANASVTAPNHAGGLIGRVDKELYSGHMYSNVLSVNVSCTEGTTCLSGYVIGTNDEYGTGVTNLRIYENSTLKKGTGEAIKLTASRTVPSYYQTANVMLKRDKLSEFKTYTSLSFSTGYYENDSGKFPRLKVSTVNYRVSFELPPVETSKGLSTPMYHLMPEVKVYAVDIDKINVEFNYIDEFTTFEINGKTYPINQKTFTFYYNFLEDFTIKLNDGISEKKVLIDHEELKNRIIIDGNDYYILDENGEIISNNTIEINNTSNEVSLGDIKPLAMKLSTTFIASGNNENNVVNMYDGKILLDNGNIYDIETGEVILNYVDNLTIVDETKPIYEYNYGSQNIKTFEDYSLVDNKYITKRIIIRDGQVEVLSNELSSGTSDVLSGYYNGKNYLVYLDDDGVIHSVKEKIVYPNNFKNYGIASISFGKNKESTYLFVKYKNNDYVLFDYQTGEVIEEKNEYVPDLFEYVKNFFKGNDSKDTTNSKYTAAKDLIDNVNSKLSDEIKNNEEIELYEGSKYTVSYNPLSDTYEVYQIPSKTSGKKSDIVKVLSDESLTKKISNSSELSKYYNFSTGTEYNWISAIIVSTITFILIAISVTILWKAIRKSE